jgi:hypothetical protein
LFCGDSRWCLGSETGNLWNGFKAQRYSKGFKVGDIVGIHYTHPSSSNSHGHGQGGVLEFSVNGEKTLGRAFSEMHRSPLRVAISSYAAGDAFELLPADYTFRR